MWVVKKPHWNYWTKRRYSCRMPITVKCHLPNIVICYVFYLLISYSLLNQNLLIYYWRSLSFRRISNWRLRHIMLFSRHLNRLQINRCVLYWRITTTPLLVDGLTNLLLLGYNSIFSYDVSPYTLVYWWIFTSYNRGHYCIA